ncbi:MAG: DNA methyltransferase, partial [Hyphomicrobium sp.]|nr:DNA methyltransferase [Hyphomicrobium sp.]
LRRPELETAEEKLAFLASHPMRGLDFDEVSPDKTHNWVNLTNNDFETLLPLASKETKAAKTAGKERAIFKLFSLGIVTNRDDWTYDFDPAALTEKVRFFIDFYNAEQKRLVGRSNITLADEVSRTIKWTSELEAQIRRGTQLEFDAKKIQGSLYRPFFAAQTYFDRIITHRVYQQPSFFPIGAAARTPSIAFMCGDRQPFALIATDRLPNLNMFSADAGQVVGLHRIDEAGNRVDNITDWALNQFTTHYKEAASTLRQAQDRPSSARTVTGTVKSVGTGAGQAKKITKQAIFHYCYAVLHDPLYREKYAQNLKREFPRIPFYAQFWQWAAWGEALMALHIGYETVAPFALARHDEPDAKARAAGLQPKALLKSDPAAGTLTLDTETTLRGVPPEAWAYQLGNRCALDWVLDQYKEKKPKDPTIREKFDTYRFGDHKDKVIDLLLRVTTVSVETVRIVAAMKAAGR